MNTKTLNNILNKITSLQERVEKLEAEVKSLKEQLKYKTDKEPNLGPAPKIYNNSIPRGPNSPTNVVHLTFDLRNFQKYINELEDKVGTIVYKVTSSPNFPKIFNELCQGNIVTAIAAYREVNHIDLKAAKDDIFYFATLVTSYQKKLIDSYTTNCFK